ncbi:hypothetical protein BJX70DRAFT_82925 [Aspergillus crustosus]
MLVKCASDIPLSFSSKGFGLQVWRTTGNTRLRQKVGYIIPVSIIEGTPRILDGPPLIPGSELSTLKTRLLYVALFTTFPQSRRVGISVRVCSAITVAMRFGQHPPEQVPCTALACFSSLVR